MAPKKTAKVVKPFSPEAEAKKLALSSVVEMHGDASVVYQNVKLGLANLRNAQSVLAARLKSWDGAEVTRANAINTAFYAAASAVEESEPHADVELAQDIASAWALRKLLLSQAEGAMVAGAVPHQEVDTILHGKGVFDCAADLVALAKLFRKHAAAIGKKTFITEEHLAQATELGTRLRQKVKPKRAKLTPGELVRARDLRNRLYTLLQQAHGELWGVAALVFGQDHMADSFPGLHAAVAARKPKAPKDAPAPTEPEALASEAADTKS